MSRTRTRVSRALIVLLAVVTLFGIIVWSQKAKPAQAAGQVAVAPPSVAAHQAIIAAVQPPASTQRPAEPGMVHPTSQPDPLQPGNTIRPALPASSSLTGKPLVDGKAKLDAGELLASRKILNEALLTGKLTEADTAAAKAMLSEISKTVTFSSKRFADDEFGGTYTVKPGDRLAKIASSFDVTPDFLMRVNGISDARKLRSGATIKILHGPVHAVVDKKKFTLDLYFGSPGEKGSCYITTLPVGLGKDNSTPDGTWMITPQNKLKNPKFWGAADLEPREADDPKNPLGEYWIGLTGTDGHAVDQQSYGIHGTIEPDSIGKMASHGCIRLREPDISLVYEVLVEGKSTVIVKE